MERKLYCGPKVRDLREKRGLTQRQLAGLVNISASYLNQIEGNYRPLTGKILIKISDALGVRHASFSEDSADVLMSMLRTALADPLFKDLAIGLNEVKTASRHLPSVSAALITLYESHTALNKRLECIEQSLDDATVRSRVSGLLQPATDEVRDYFQSNNNYIDVLDRKAEDLSTREGLFGAGHLERLTAYLNSRHGIATITHASPSTKGMIYSFCDKTRVLHVNKFLDRSTQAFAVAYHIGVAEYSVQIGEVTKSANLQAPGANDICRIALANYFARALVLPYARLLATLAEHRYDFEFVAHLFDTSLETVCNRVPAMQRRQAEAVPFYFIRIDKAGNVSKRQNLGSLQLSRFGATCPLWNVHEAFEKPGQTIVQVISTSDGRRFLSIAREIVKSESYFLAPVRRYAVGFGCELCFAEDVVYGNDLDFRNLNLTNVGPGCLLCDQENCSQRAIPRAISRTPETHRFPIALYPAL
jgi:predicted transcriptional regulator/transcriptional regulator with XRE-family HTH domain